MSISHLKNLLIFQLNRDSHKLPTSYALRSSEKHESSWKSPNPYTDMGQQNLLRHPLMGGGLRYTDKFNVGAIKKGVLK